MLKSIDPLLDPDLLHTLALMGHGDKLAIVDQNYPAASSCKRIHYLTGADTRAAARAILSVFPVDDFDEPAAHKIVPTGKAYSRVESHAEFSEELDRAEHRAVSLYPLERFDFYAATKDCFAIVQTGERRGFSCFIITKGVIR